MHWTELARGAAQYAESKDGPQENADYSCAVTRLDWAHGDLGENLDICLDYLSRWGEEDKADKAKIEQVFKDDIAKLGDCVEPVVLERHGMLKVEDKGDYGVYCAGQAISHIYDAMTAACGAENASIILHLRFPKLFITVGEGVQRYFTDVVKLQEAYSVDKETLFKGYGYAFVLLPFVKSQAVDAVMTCARENNIDPKEAIVRLGGIMGEARPIARVMNEYYQAMAR